MIKFYLVSILIFTTFGLSASSTFKIQSSTTKFQVPYTFGTHEGEAKALDGSINLKKGGTIELPITSLKTDNEEMNCHLYEALGINYENSDFPDDHVCEDNKLPSTGPNSVAYPTIKFTIQSVQILEQTDALFLLKLNGIWNMHGVSKSDSFNLKLKKSGTEWVSNLSFELSLKDFKIIVKRFLVIAVEDIVTINSEIRWITQ